MVIKQKKSGTLWDLYSGILLAVQLYQADLGLMVVAMTYSPRDRGCHLQYVLYLCLYAWESGKEPHISLYLSTRPVNTILKSL